MHVLSTLVCTALSFIPLLNTHITTAWHYNSTPRIWPAFQPLQNQFRRSYFSYVPDAFVDEVVDNSSLDSGNLDTDSASSRLALSPSMDESSSFLRRLFTSSKQASKKVDEYNGKMNELQHQRLEACQADPDGLECHSLGAKLNEAHKKHSYWINRHRSSGFRQYHRNVNKSFINSHRKKFHDTLHSTLNQHRDNTLEICGDKHDAKKRLSSQCKRHKLQKHRLKNLHHEAFNQLEGHSSYDSTKHALEKERKSKERIKAHHQLQNNDKLQLKQNSEKAAPPQHDDKQLVKHHKNSEHHQDDSSATDKQHDDKQLVKHHKNSEHHQDDSSTTDNAQPDKVALTFPHSTHQVHSKTNINTPDKTGTEPKSETKPNEHNLKRKRENDPLPDCPVWKKPPSLRKAKDEKEKIQKLEDFIKTYSSNQDKAKTEDEKHAWDCRAKRAKLFLNDLKT